MFPVSYRWTKEKKKKGGMMGMMGMKFLGLVVGRDKGDGRAGHDRMEVCKSFEEPLS